MTTTAQLINWIDSHDRPAPTVDEMDGTVTVYSEVRTNDGVWHMCADTIPATYSAARQLLGY